MTWNYILGVSAKDFVLESETAQVLGIGYTNTAETVKRYHNAGKKVICYLSVGTIADYDPDKADYEAVPGLVKTRYGQWPKERWVDYRLEGIKPLIRNRMKRAVSIGCDGIEPDNLGGYTHDEVKSWSNPLTKDDAIKYAKWLSNTAHDMGISIGLKNVLGILETVGSYFDYAINESCILWNECYRYKNFLNSGKAVFGVTYGDVNALRSSLCRNLEGLPISMIVKKSNQLYQERTIFDVNKYCGTSSSSRAVSLPTNYVTVKFKGILDNTTNHYLGVQELKEYPAFNIYELNDSESFKYYTWHLTSETSPSLMYLSTGEYGAEGKPSKYCLDLGSYKNSEGYNYLSIVECSSAKYKFKYSSSYSRTIDIYTLDGNHHTDSNGNKLCLYYSMTPRISRCKNPDSSKNMGWTRYYV